MKLFLWTIFLILIVACSAVVILAPWLGLGEKYDFFLYRSVGITRTLALVLLLSPIFVLILYKVLKIGGITRRSFRLLFKKGIQQTFKNVDFWGVTVVAVAIVVGWGTLLINFHDPAWNERFLPEHIEVYKMVDTQPQRLAFFAFFFAIVLGSLLVPLLAKKLGQQFPNRSLMTSILGMLVIIVILAGVVQYLPLPVLAAAIILASVATLARHRHGIKIVWASTAILVAFAIAAGFLVTPVWSSVSTFFWPGPDLHYAGVFS